MLAVDIAVGDNVAFVAYDDFGAGEDFWFTLGDTKGDTVLLFAATVTVTSPLLRVPCGVSECVANDETVAN